MRSSIVLGLQFGDEGKGITTDYLCSQQDPRETLVIRFSGGQQAGHTVVRNGIKHIHSNYGSGALRGIDTYISEYCTFYPKTMFSESIALAQKGQQPNIYIHPLAKLTTPYDVAFNRIHKPNLEHGSCGMGIGTTMRRNIETGYKLFAIDTTNKSVLRAKLREIEHFYRLQVSDLCLDIYNRVVKEEEELFFNSLNQNLFTLTTKTKKREHYIFEGSQGILLDMDHGVFPNVTYGNTTSKNAIVLCNKMYLDPTIYYVTRCYQTRHGSGWMSNEKKIDLVNNEAEINQFNPYQGDFRVGELDYDLLNYSLDIDNIYSFSRKKNLIVTCMDQRPDFQLNTMKFRTDFNEVLLSHSAEANFSKLQTS